MALLTFWAGHLFAVGDCLMHFRMFINILSLHPLDASSTPSSSHDNFSRYCQMSAKITPNLFSPHFENYCSKAKRHGLEVEQKGMVWRYMTRTTLEQEGTNKRDVLTKALFQTLGRHLRWDKGQEKDKELGQTGFQSYNDRSNDYQKCA